MEIGIRAYETDDLPALRALWNRVVARGDAFPQILPLGEAEAAAFFAGQSFTGVAVWSDGTVVGLYILHPNNIGRCGHLANASYAVNEGSRGGGIGRALVQHSLQKARALGFGVLQFNAVVASNHSAIALYEKMGFVCLGRVPEGFQKPDHTYEDILLFYYKL